MSSSSSSSYVRIGPKKRKTGHKNRMHIVRPNATPSTRVMDVSFPIPQTLGNNVYNVIQTGSVFQVVSSTGGNTYGSFITTFSLLDQVASLTSVFDQYRIRCVEITFRPRVSQESSASANVGQFATVIDVDDNINLSSFGQASDYQTCLIGRGFDSQVRTFIPHCANALSSGGTFSGYGNVESPWIDTTSQTVTHYGLKYAWTTTDAVYTIDVTSRFWYQFKNVR